MPTSNFHRLLNRQIKNHLSPEQQQDEQLHEFLRAIHEAYVSYDKEYLQLQHILELSNKESFKALKDLQFALNQVASVFTVNANGEIQEVNENFYRLTQYNRDKVIGKRYTDVFLKSDENDEIAHKIKNQLLNTQNWRGEILIHKEDGQQLYTDTSIIPILNDKNEILKYLFISFDISEEKKAKENLILSEVKYRSIISNMNLGLVEVDFDEKILTANQSFADMSGYKLDELIGKHTFDIIISDNNRGVIENKKQLRKEKVSDAYEIEYINPKGEKRYWLISGAPMYNNLGETIGSIGIHFDITDRKEQEQKMEMLLDNFKKVNKDLNDFAYIVSHDLKAPLRGIGSLATWLENDYADKLDQEGKETLRLLVQRTQRMHNLIDGILHFSKIGKSLEQNTLIHTQALVNKIIQETSVPSHIKIEVENNLEDIHFDENYFTQIIKHLLGNAIKFMDKPQGLIQIDCIPHQEFTEFTISDNGPGINEKYHDKIFQIFQTVNARDEFESTGIGLSIVKKILETAGGKITVKAKEGEGTKFSFLIKK